jgi:Ca2+/H+ antiporter, TMEM165/GDT1 family
MQAFFISVAVVALAEFGDKTQMLALVLAARFRRPAPLLLGILFATLANHALAAALGAWIAATLGPRLLQSVLGMAFIAMALWTLRPDRSDQSFAGLERAGGSAGTEGPVRRDASGRPTPALRVFGTALAGFFVLEMGDKTQLATVTLAARYHTLVPVLVGSTIGMLCADAIAVLLGEVAAKKLPLRLLRSLAAATFLLIGARVLLGAKA